MDVARSDVVRSCAGRDSGQLFFVVELDESYVYLADGKGRRAEKPKRKKRKHTAHEGTCDEWTRERMFVNGRLTNSEIRKALAQRAGDADEGAPSPQSN